MSFSSELNFIIYCCRPDSAKRTQELETLAASVNDWNSFERLVERHRVGPIVARQIRAANLKSMPASTLEALRANARQNGLRMLKYEATNRMLERFCREKKLNYATIKGPSLAKNIYGDLACRHSRDLDIVVDAESLDEVRSFLLREGYSEEEFDFASLSPKQRAHVIKHKHHLSFFSDIQALRIEVHWKKRGILSRLVKDGEYGSFSPQNCLLHLCEHGSDHGWFRLKWIVDIAWLLGRFGKDLDWDELWNESACLGLNESLALGLALAADLFNISLSEEAAERIENNPRIDYLQEYVFARLASPKTVDTHLDVLRSIRYHKLIAPKVRKYRNSWWRLLTLSNPQDWKLLPLPDKLFFLYSILRPALWGARKLSEKRHDPEVKHPVE